MTVQLNTLAYQNCCACTCGPTTTRTVDGRVQFENDNYQITVNDRGEVRIFNKNTGENYRIWGDPHVDVDGQRAFDFWGQTTFQLDDGTKVTIETTPWRGSEDMTIASKVTITDGDYGVHITGVDDNHLGDLAFTEVDGLGGLLDGMVRDGNTIYENPIGKGFVAFDHCGNITSVDQDFINATDELKSNQLMELFSPLLALYAGLFSITFSGTFLAGLFDKLTEGAFESQPEDLPIVLVLTRSLYD